MRKPSLVELDVVVAVATQRNFRAAATELGVSRSALSHAVATLEQRMGVRLFNRTTRSVALSDAGERFLSRVRPALKEISDAVEAAAEARDTPSGALRINASEGAVRWYLLPAILEFAQRYPDVRLEIVTQDGLVDIVADGFDAGVQLAEAVPQDMVAVRCGADVRFAVVGSKHYFKSRPLPKVPAELGAHHCIRRRWPSGAIYRWEFERRAESLVMDVSGPLTLDNDEFVLEAARAGLGLAYVTEASVTEDLAAGRLIRSLADWTPAYPGPRLYYPGHRHVPAALRAFIDIVRATQKPKARKR
jgi:DNA-binding transcriptional LysR family regulator